MKPTNVNENIQEEKINTGCNSTGRANNFAIETANEFASLKNNIINKFFNNKIFIGERKMKRTLIFKTAVAVFIASILLTAEAFCAFNFTYSNVGDRINKNQSIKLSTSGGVSGGTVKVSFDLDGMLLPLGNYSTNTTVTIPITNNSNITPMLNKMLDLYFSDNSTSDVMLVVEDNSYANYKKSVKYKPRNISFYQDRLDYNYLNCFKEPRKTELFLNSIWVAGSWVAPSFNNKTYGADNYKIIATKWYDENNNFLPTVSGWEIMIGDRPTNKQHYCVVTISNGTIIYGAPATYSDTLWGEAPQIGKLDISYSVTQPTISNPKGKVTIDFNSHGGDLVYVRSIPANAIGPVATYGDPWGQGTAVIENLAPGDYTLYVYTAIKGACDSTINITMNDPERVILTSPLNPLPAGSSTMEFTVKSRSIYGLVGPPVVLLTYVSSVKICDYLGTVFAEYPINDIVPATGIVFNMDVRNVPINRMCIAQAFDINGIAVSKIVEFYIMR